ncbi:MAG: hypothetical protein OEU26_33260, partial [Candidatus Tectomicrobia bacterium]|nr:hypothetical protein [Candidatus Tectomicrobia bacterium]
DEVDLIIYENEWNDALRDVKIAQEQIKAPNFSKQSRDSSHIDIFDKYTKSRKYGILDIVSAGALTGFKSILPQYNKDRHSILSTQKRLYDLANDQRVAIKYSNKSSVKGVSPLKASQQYAQQNRRNQVTFSYQRDGIVVKLIETLSGLLQYFYANKIQAVLLGLVCIGCYLFFNTIVLRRYAAKR